MDAEAFRLWKPTASGFRRINVFQPGRKLGVVQIRVTPEAGLTLAGGMVPP